MTTYVTPQDEYEVQARRIAGTRVEKLRQIDAAVEELLEIKMLECRSDQPNLRFLAVPRPRSHVLGMTITILALLVLLVLLLGVHVSYTATARPPVHAAGSRPHVSSTNR